jgi:hypothetical protein
MSRQNILSVIFVLALAGAGYLIFSSFRSSPLENETVLSASSEENDLALTLESLRRLKSIQLDVSVFEDAFFRSLVVPPEPADPDIQSGRENPFVPF